MKTVAAKELKLRLGRYLNDVRSGETVRVTVRGNPVAEIRPLAPSAHDRLLALIREGRATPASQPAPMPRPAGTASKRSPMDVLLDDRYGDDAPLS